MSYNWPAPTAAQADFFIPAGNIPGTAASEPPPRRRASWGTEAPGTWEKRRAERRKATKAAKQARRRQR